MQLGKATCHGLVFAHAGKGGLDLGPSILAAVTETVAFKTDFCPKTADKAKAVRRVQR